MCKYHKYYLHGENSEYKINYTNIKYEIVQKSQCQKIIT